VCGSDDDDGLHEGPFIFITLTLIIEYTRRESCTPCQRVNFPTTGQNDNHNPAALIITARGTKILMLLMCVCVCVFIGAVDEDSDENQLVFYVVGSRGGFPALKDDPQVPLHNFSQAQINQSLIVFSHKGRRDMVVLLSVIYECSWK